MTKLSEKMQISYDKCLEESSFFLPELRGLMRMSFFRFNNFINEVHSLEQTVDRLFALSIIMLAGFILVAIFGIFI